VYTKLPPSCHWWNWRNPVSSCTIDGVRNSGMNWTDRPNSCLSPLQHHWCSLARDPSAYSGHGLIRPDTNPTQGVTCSSLLGVTPSSPWFTTSLTARAGDIAHRGRDLNVRWSVISSVPDGGENFFSSIPRTGKWKTFNETAADETNRTGWGRIISLKLTAILLTTSSRVLCRSNERESASAIKPPFLRNFLPVLTLCQVALIVYLVFSQKPFD
jgi:hypothetical protein